ncbi:MAG TPA: hypothetical protein VHS99_21290 [Chloroflexota bacterium]|nr:hypothetical protein [Chloroflexota bacterium]
MATGIAQRGIGRTVTLSQDGALELWLTGEPPHPQAGAGPVAR